MGKLLKSILLPQWSLASSRVGSQLALKMKFVGPLILYQELLKTKPLRADRLIGIGIGLKHVTFAESDPYGKVAHRLKKGFLINLQLLSTSSSDINKSVFSQVPAGLVIGFPYCCRSRSPIVLPTMYMIDESRESGKFEGLKYTVWDVTDVPRAHEYFIWKDTRAHELALEPKYEDTVAAIVLQVNCLITLILRKT
ncbi:hypothetical protein Ddye_024817 [Dipteronia dyeriana]|uniref:Uncharacterized protein n=1 Tax=Dipteronia dyeriana TaxID=168575 RepID=A0AAD9TWK2_9ROSI|nr:hypothetical protein Ddye_024817 [Dipteronia dyeriana]